jgi:hypothetical protein
MNEHRFVDSVRKQQARAEILCTPKTIEEAEKD